MIYFLLIVIIIGLLIYIYSLNRQLVRIHEILDRRVKEETSQIVSVDLINRNMNKLVCSINDCLKAEENLRLNSIQKEKQFKELIANISHDLRTPLTAIKGYQQMLQRELLTESQKSKLDIAVKHTDKLGELIEHFFEYAYMVNHIPNCNLERVNLTNQVAEYLISLIPMLEERGREVIYDDSRQIHSTVDKEMLGRILQNLIKNCVQHGEGYIYVSIITSEKTEKEPMAGISVANRITPNPNLKVEQLFDRFYTADHAREQTTGLGLAIVKGLVEQMNGRVSAQIKEGMLVIRVLFPAI